MGGVTINTDASFKKGIGAYAYWIKCDHFTLKGSGYFKDKVKDPSVAEAQCIANAIVALTNYVKDLQFDYMVINTDSMWCVNGIKAPKNEIFTLIAGLLNKFKDKTNCNKLSVRHVKAHTGKKNKRSWVNNWCDQECKRQRIIAENLEV